MFNGLRSRYFSCADQKQWAMLLGALENVMDVVGQLNTKIHWVGEFLEHVYTCLEETIDFLPYFTIIFMMVSCHLHVPLPTTCRLGAE